MPAPDDGSRDVVTHIRARFVEDPPHPRASIPYRPPVIVPSAQQLSEQRRRKVKEMDTVLPHHLNNVFHMHRRIKELWEHSKGMRAAGAGVSWQYDSARRPRTASAGRRGAATRSSVTIHGDHGASHTGGTGMTGAGKFEPKTPSKTPARGASLATPYTGGRRTGGGGAGGAGGDGGDGGGGDSDDGFGGAGGRRGYAEGTPADNIRLRYGRHFIKGHGVEYHNCKSDIIREIIVDRLYREHELRALFDKYLSGFRGHRRHVVEIVVKDLEEEFDVLSHPESQAKAHLEAEKDLTARAARNVSDAAALGRTAPDASQRTPGAGRTAAQLQAQAEEIISSAWSREEAGREGRGPTVVHITTTTTTTRSTLNDR